MTTEERLWNKTQINNGCWEWHGCIDKKSGYGKIAMWKERHDRTPEYVHRVSYKLNHGCIPESKDVLHTCDNPKCWNPKHLYAGTPVDNARDMMERNRHPTITLEAHNRLIEKKRDTFRTKLFALWIYARRYDLAKQLRAQGLTLLKIAIILKSSETSIHRILRCQI